MPGYVEGKDKNEILKALVGTGQVGSSVHEQQKMGIIVRCTEDIEKALGSFEKSVNDSAGDLEKVVHSLQESMTRNAVSGDRLATKVFWLNLILAIATVIGTVVAVAQVFFKK